MNKTSLILLSVVFVAVLVSAGGKFNPENTEKIVMPFIYKALACNVENPEDCQNMLIGIADVYQPVDKYAGTILLVKVDKQWYRQINTFIDRPSSTQMIVKTIDLSDGFVKIAASGDESPAEGSSYELSLQVINSEEYAASNIVEIETIALTLEGKSYNVMLKRSDKKSIVWHLATGQVEYIDDSGTGEYGG